MESYARRLSRCTWIGIGSFLLLLGVPFSLSPRAAPTVYFQPHPICGGSSGTEFSASIYVDGSGDSICCFYLLLTYDRDRLTLLSATEGDLFRLSGHSTLFIWEQPQDADTTGIIDVLLGALTYVLGPGELVKLTFRVEQCPSDTAGLYLVEHRFEPLPEAYAALSDRYRVNIPGVRFEDAISGVCGGCESGVLEEVNRIAGVLTIAPNPVTGWLAFSWALPKGAVSGHLEVFSVNGRKVFAKTIPKKRGSTIWELCDLSGQPIAPGAYFTRLQSGGRTLRRKFFHLR